VKDRPLCRQGWCVWTGDCRHSLRRSPFYVAFRCGRRRSERQ
jgi:hypothetical protein